MDILVVVVEDNRAAMEDNLMVGNPMVDSLVVVEDILMEDNQVVMVGNLVVDIQEQQQEGSLKEDNQVQQLVGNLLVVDILLVEDSLVVDNLEVGILLVDQFTK